MNGEVVVGCSFVLDRLREVEIVPLPVVGSIFHIELLTFLCCRDGLHNDAVAVGDPYGLEVRTPVEPVIYPATPARADVGSWNLSNDATRDVHAMCKLWKPMWRAKSTPRHSLCYEAETIKEALHSQPGNKQKSYQNKAKRKCWICEEDNHLMKE